MSKKIKISEAQLERLVKSNARLIKEEEALDEIGVGSIEMGIAKEVAPMIVDKLKEMSINGGEINLDIFSRSLAHEITQLSRGGESTDDMEPEIGDGELSMSDDEMGDESFSDENEPNLDETLNESMKQYRTEFDRYMKSPKQ
jgi:hypothetical protein